MDSPTERKSKILECKFEAIGFLFHLHDKINPQEARVEELESRINLNIYISHLPQKNCSDFQFLLHEPSNL